LSHRPWRYGSKVKDGSSKQVSSHQSSSNLYDLCSFVTFLHVDVLYLLVPLILGPITAIFLHTRAVRQGGWCWIQLAISIAICLLLYCAGIMKLSVGGQQPGQSRSAPSNVLQQDFTIQGTTFLGRF
jgi:hypothetical protein